MHAGAPDDTGEYAEQVVDGIKVFISPLVDASNGLRIYMSGFSVFKGLAVAPLGI